MHVSHDNGSRIFTYVVGCVELYDLVGQAPNVWGHNESTHFELQREENSTDILSNAWGPAFVKFSLEKIAGKLGSKLWEV